VKYLFTLVMVLGLPAGVLAQETVLRQTKLPLDVRYELIVWTGSSTLRLDKNTGAVDILTGGILVNGIPQVASWESTEIKRTPLEGFSNDPAFAVSPSWSSPRFQIVSSGSTSMLFDTMTGRLWFGESIKKVRADGFSYQSIQWRPFIDERGNGGADTGR
jgi:hypothetical protein